MESPVAVDVLMHFMEAYRPSSTGHLIGRVIPSSRTHVFRKERPIVREELRRDGCELWILHPQGESLPREAPANLQVLLLDGTWVQSSDMSRAVAGLGRRVNLPMTGESRYWLRAQAGAGKFSTIESLLFLYDALGFNEAERTLRLQFELHVYATLLARGHKQRAIEYLRDSPIASAMPEVIAAL
jgi:DTW domain-containing protein